MSDITDIAHMPKQTHTKIEIHEHKRPKSPYSTARALLDRRGTSKSHMHTKHAKHHLIHTHWSTPRPCTPPVVDAAGDEDEGNDGTYEDDGRDLEVDVDNGHKPVMSACDITSLENIDDISVLEAEEETKEGRQVDWKQQPRLQTGWRPKLKIQLTSCKSPSQTWTKHNHHPSPYKYYTHSTTPT